ncbi:MAG: hypothetical protein ACXWZF_00425 [Actinomycetota bacterium]
MKRIILVVILLASIGVAAQPTAAHPATRFKACTRHLPGMCMRIGAAFDYGGTVVVKGKVRPVHAGFRADVLRRKPHGSIWRKVAEVRVSDAGTMRYRWRTSIDDVVQDAPYRFKFRIRGHATSNATEAYVLFGE